MRQARIPYSAAEMIWLEANRMMVISDYHTAFCAEFNRDDVTAAHLHGLRKRQRWLVGRTTKGMSIISSRFSRAELAWLHQNCTRPIADYHFSFCSEFDRTDVSAESLHSLRKRKGWKTGRDGRFVKGQESFNKGKPCPPGKMGNHPNARRTQFKRGRAPTESRNYVPIGTEVVRDGYLVRKIKDTGPTQGRWRFVHLVEWEKVHGPLPTGMCLKCQDGNPLNTALSNWELISRGALAYIELGRRWKGIDFNAAPAELKAPILAIAKLKHASRSKARA